MELEWIGLVVWSGLVGLGCKEYFMVWCQVQGMVFNGSSVVDGSFASFLQLQPQLQSNTLTATSSSLPCLVTLLFFSLLGDFSLSCFVTSLFSSLLPCLVTFLLPAYSYLLLKRCYLTLLLLLIFVYTACPALLHRLQLAALPQCRALSLSAASLR
jgi:hypothetical protein